MQVYLPCKTLLLGRDPKLFALTGLSKSIQVMKITAILLLAASLQVSATGWTQEKITLSYNNAPLEKVLNTIKTQVDVVFVYRTDYIKDKKITIHVTNATLTTALDLCLKTHQLTYEIVGNNVAIHPVKKEKDHLSTEASMIESSSPFIDLRGRVVNEKGEPVPGVTVLVKGSNKSTLTNANGEFALLTVEKDATLVFTHVSMESFQLKVSGKTELIVHLKAKISMLGDVVVRVNTGYQQINSERFVGSYAQLDSANFHRRAGMNIVDRLDGTVPGILFNKKGSVANSSLMIRGISTIGYNGTSTAPLIVVDNFPMTDAFNLNNINPNDVENITILKDAAAASIWGASAGNGVIVVTTKKGAYNRRFQLNLSSNITIEEKPDLFYYPRISSSDFIDIEDFLFTNGFYDASINNTGDRPVLSPVVEILNRKKAGTISSADATNLINEYRGHDTRNEINKLVYRKATRQQHYLEFSGGTNMLAYQLSAGYNRNLNNIKGSRRNDQFTINTHTSFRPFGNMEIQTALDLALNNTQAVGLPSITGFPYLRLADEHGVPLDIPYGYRTGYLDTAGASRLLDWKYRPLDEIRLANNNNSERFTRLRLGITYKLTSWLKASVNYQYQLSNNNIRIYKSIDTWETRDLINRFTNYNQSSPNLRYPVPVGGILDLSNSQAKQYNLRGALNFNKDLGEAHQITAMAGGEISDSKGGYGGSQRIYGYNDQTGSYRTSIDYFDPYPRIYAAFPGTVAYIPANNGYVDRVINRFVSVFANASYSFKEKYNLYASARKDGANIYGVNTNNKWKPLWSVGAGWEITKENFSKSTDLLPYLKIRASYGFTGNSNNTISGRFIINNLTSTEPITNLPISQPGIAPNPDLRWEEVRIMNVGLDFKVLKSIITGSLEIFRKNSNDVIANAPLPPSSGVNSFTLNFAKLKTSGYEIVLNSKNISGHISWTTNLTMSHAKTTVTDLFTSLGHKVSDYYSYSLNAIPGRVVYGLGSYQWAGLDPATGDPQGYHNKEVSKDYNAIFNDSIQNQIFHGSAIPLTSGYLRNNISWKGFTLSVNITGRFNYYFREPALTLDYSAGVSGTNYGTDYYNRWQKPGDEAFTDIPSMPYPVPGAVGQRNQFYRFAAIHVKRADNIRWQDASLSWELNTLKDKRFPIKSARLFVYLNNINLILWRSTDSPFDPDFSGGVDEIAAPVPKTWTAGLTFNF